MNKKECEKATNDEHKKFDYCIVNRITKERTYFKSSDAKNYINSKGVGIIGEIYTCEDRYVYSCGMAQKPTKKEVQENE